MPISTNVPRPLTSSTSGITARRGVAHTANPSPASAASRTGSLTRLEKNVGSADGISPSVRWRPRSSADELV